jgi:hypothetical protein
MDSADEMSNSTVNVAVYVIGVVEVYRSFERKSVPAHRVSRLA